ncbi:MAG TPA: hypothetical protein PL154_00335, partial [Candidatus Woesebacteria bacterium]|nr:hypothetical protein [Candidatus Woesebacteria bacterium]
GGIMANHEQLSLERFSHLCRKYDVPLQLISAIQEEADPIKREQLCNEVGRFLISAMCSFRIENSDANDVRIAAGLDGDENIAHNIIFPSKIR